MPLVINDYEAFCLVQDHLLSQNEKAKDTNDDCQYRGYLPSTLEDIMNKAQQDVIDSTNEYDDEVIFSRMYDLLADTLPDAKCAVGCLITDDFYNQSFEGRTLERSCHVWDAVETSNPLWHMNDASYEMLRKLQTIHDNNETEIWEVLLSRMSTNFDKHGNYEIEEENEQE
jgi:hypothetical protein